MMFRQVLQVDKVITQLLAGRRKTDKQVSRRPCASGCGMEVLQHQSHAR
jgi:hypothetical protein